MNELLLRRYIREVVENHKVSEDIDEEESHVDDDLSEFSGVGAIVGYTAPLGATSEDMGAERGKKKDPDWA